MVNKLKVKKNKVDSNRYLRGLSVPEMEDMETSIEEALENPVGTFAVATREVTSRLSNLNKMVKTIGVDTKYIRKAIDKLDKKIDAIESGGGFGGGFSAADALTAGAGALALRGLISRFATYGSRLGKMGTGAAGLMSSRAWQGLTRSGTGLQAPKIPKIGGKPAEIRQGPWGTRNPPAPNVPEKPVTNRFGKPGLGKNLLGRAGLLGLAYGATDLFVQNVDKPDESGEGTITGWLNRNVYDLDGKMFELFGSGIDRRKYPLYKKTEDIEKKINKIQKTIENKTPTQSESGNIVDLFKELNPSERAQIIVDRLKMMTSVPKEYSSVTSPGIMDSLSLMTPDWPISTSNDQPTGQINGASGKGRGGGGGGGWGDDTSDTSVTSKKANVPSLTPSEFMTLEKSGLAGTRDNSNMVQPIKPGQYRPVYSGIEQDIKNRDLIDIIGNEARRTNESTDAVINNMMNRLGSKSYGNPKTLTEVAKQKGQYESWDFLKSGRFRRVDEKRAKQIEERLKIIASGQEPDITGGANEFRASSYVFGDGRGKTFARKAARQGNKNLGGNVYANTGYEPGPYAAYSPEQVEANKRQAPSGEKIDPVTLISKTNKDINNKPKTIAENTTKQTGKLFKNSHLAAGMDADLVRVAEKAAKDNPGLFGMPGQNDMDGVVSGKRSAEQQKEMIKRGWSKTMNSKHLHGRAIDLWPINPKTGKLDAKYEEGYSKINAAMKKAAKELNIPVEWGGDWNKFVDKPHWQFARGYKSKGKPYNEVIDEKMKTLENKVDKIDKIVPNNIRRDIFGYSRQIEKNSKDGIFKESAPGLIKPTEMNPKKITPTLSESDVTKQITNDAVEEAKQAAEKAAMAAAAVTERNVPKEAPPKIPRISTNPAPLSKLPKTAKRNAVNPTEKAPGADSNKLNQPVPLAYDDPYTIRAFG